MACLGPRELILDEDLPKRLRTALERRGFEVSSVRSLNLGGRGDDDMLTALRRLRDPAAVVLVTSDNKMPLVHAKRIAETGFTIATLDGGWERRGYEDQDQWRHDVVHRWAHAMADHAERVIRRYSPSQGVAWTAPRRTRVNGPE